MLNAVMRLSSKVSSVLIIGTCWTSLFSFLGSKVIYLACHLPWVKVIFHHFEVLFQCVKCLILIFGTCEVPSVIMSTLKTHLVCHLSCLNVIFRHYEVILQCVNCLILILGTCPATFVYKQFQNTLPFGQICFRTFPYILRVKPDNFQASKKNVHQFLNVFVS